MLDRADACGADQTTPAGVLPAIEQLRDRPVYLDLEANLPSAITAQWYWWPDADSIAVRRGLPTRDRAVAHELGHMMLGHEGVAVPLNRWTPNADTSAFAWTMRRRRSRVEWDHIEWEAERFAALLCYELRRRAGYRRATRPGVLADAFG
ncbi:ImmA/IrrE family metallo-endopeptidase [Tomitella cavernea]|uniref:ImmA/IrrE family metallo-endopeptidase n=1 Tax=Tomitella cavernea TaxID=1387982 RepID=A0ABP9D2C3_9ACTN|nr:hypothetical protein [Tomitella cavernea]